MWIESILPIFSAVLASLVTALALTALTASLRKRMKAKIRVGGIDVQITPRTSDQAYAKLVERIAQLKEHPQVFVVYPHDEKKFVRKLAGDLAKAEVSVWVDEHELRAGDRITTKIKQGMDESQWIIVIPPSEKRERGWIFKEIRMALDAERVRQRPLIIPVKTPSNIIPEMFSDTVCADFSANYEEGLANLMKAIVRRAEA